MTGTEQPVTLDLKGAVKVSADGSIILLKSDKPEDTNTITDREKIVPVTSKLSGVGKTFTHTFDPYSISIVKINTIKVK